MVRRGPRVNLGLPFELGYWTNPENEWGVIPSKWVVNDRLREGLTFDLNWLGEGKFKERRPDYLEGDLKATPPPCMACN